MASNQYRKHLDRDHSNPLSAVREVLGATVKTAALVAGVYAGAKGLKYIAGEGDYTRALKFADTMKTMGDATSFLRGTLRGINKSVVNDGFVNTFLGKSPDSLSKNIIDELDPFFKGYGKKLAGEDVMFTSEMKKIINAKAQMEDNLFQEYRRDYVVTRLKNLKQFKVGDIDPKTKKAWRPDPTKKDPYDVTSNYIDPIKDRVEKSGYSPVDRAIEMFQTDGRLQNAGMGVKDLKQRNKVITEAVDNALEKMGRINKSKSGPAGAPNTAGPGKVIRDTLLDALNQNAKMGTGTDNMSTTLRNKWKSRKAAKVDFWTSVQSDVQNNLGALTKHAKEVLQRKPEGFGWLQKVFEFAGYRQMTVGQAISHGYIDKTIAYDTITKKGFHKTEDQLMSDNLRKLFDKAPVDPLVFIKTHGRAKPAVVDARFIEQAARGTWNTLANNIHIPILGFKPLQLLPILKKTAMRETPIAIFKSGYNTPGLINKKGRLRQDYIYYGGALFDEKGKKLRKNLSLESAVSGRYAKTGSYMMGGMERPITETGLKGWLQNITDLGTQQQSNMFRKAYSRYGKWKDPDYARNLLSATKNYSIFLRQPKAGEDMYSGLDIAYKTFLQSVENQTQPLTNNVMELLGSVLEPSGPNAKYARKAYDRLAASSSDQELINALIEISQGSQIKGTLPVKNIAEINYIIKQYDMDKTGFLNQHMRTIQAGPRAGSVYTRRDEALKAAQSAILASMDTGAIRGYGSVGEYTTDIFKRGLINTAEYNDIYDLMLYNQMKGVSKDGETIFREKFASKMTDTRMVDEFLNIVTGKTSAATPGFEIFSERLTSIVRSDNPIIAEHGVKNFKSVIDGKYMVVAQSDGYKKSASIAKSMIGNINQAWKQGESVIDNIGNVFDNIQWDKAGTLGRSIWQDTRKIFSELGLGPKSGKYGRAGGLNPFKATRLTHDSYFLLSRLNDIYLNAFGIGLNPGKIPDAQTLAKNLFLKRIALPLFAFTAASYLDFEAGNILGKKPSDIAVETHANVSIGFAKMKSAVGLNRFGKRFESIRPGFNRLWENPVGKSLKIASFGILGETRTGEELSKHYSSGYNEVRKGRYWGFGSTTPFYGCLSPWSQIQTQNGFTRADQIALGDQVLTKSGEYHVVEEILPREVNEPIYKAITKIDRTETVELTGNHQILCIKHKECDGKRKYSSCYPHNNEICNDCNKYKEHTPEWIPIEEVDVGDFLMYPVRKGHDNRVVIPITELLNGNRCNIFDGKLYAKTDNCKLPLDLYNTATHICNLPTNNGPTGDLAVAIEQLVIEYDGIATRAQIRDLVYDLRYNKRQQYRGYKYLYDIEDNIELNYDFGKLLGFYAAEGDVKSDNSTTRFAFHQDEQDYHNEVIRISKEMFGANSNILITHDSNGVVVQVCNSLLSELCSTLIPGTAKAGNKHISNQLMEFTNKEFWYGFLTGYIQGDGTQRKNETKIGCATYQLLKDVQHIALRLGIIGQILSPYTYKGTNRVSHTLIFSGYQNVLLHAITETKIDIDKSTSCVIEYTHGIYWYDESTLAVEICDIEINNYIGTVYDFQIDTDPSFVAAGFIMHNSRISHFEPSYYRQKLGKPQYTDSLWGSEKEYWANSWMPNLRNPLGPLKTWTPLGAYHYDQNKYFPAAITGPIPELEAMPLVGPLLSSTVGRVLKPPIKHPKLRASHKQYLQEINEAYSNIYREQFNALGAKVSTAGNIKQLTTVPEYGSEEYYATGGLYGAMPQYKLGVGRGTGEGLAGVGIAGDQSYSEEGSGYGTAIIGGTGPGASAARSNLTSINQELAMTPARGMRYMTDPRRLDVLRDNIAVQRLGQAANPHSLGYAMGKTVYSGTELAGIYGFMTTMLMGGDIAPEVALQSGERMYGYERRFWEKNLGGFGGGLSEVYRRFLPHKRNQITQYNPIRNAMPEWLPNQTNYFVDFQHGIPMIDKYYMRLPGPGYEAVNKLHPDAFGRYGAIDRAKILGDIAPWSEQYSYYSKVVTKMHQEGLINDTDYEEVEDLRERVKRQKTKYDFFPNKFKGIRGQLKTQRLTISRQIDPITFMTAEYPEHPIRLAGIRLPSKSSPQYQDALRDLGKLVTVGDSVVAQISRDPLKVYKNDVMQTIPVAIQDAMGQPVARTLARRYSDIKAKWDSTDPVSVAALFSQAERRRGARWEYLSHMSTPVHTKLLQARTPLEHYERNFVYGKNWKSWNKPVRSWIAPMFSTWASYNPIEATGRGALLGAMFGGLSILSGKSIKTSAKYGALIGGAVAGTLSTLRTTSEIVTRPIRKNSTYIPLRRRRERNIDEYFDKLKYIKFSGLYFKARQLSIKMHGVDPQDILDDIEEQSGRNASVARRFKEAKRRLYIDIGSPFQEEKDRRTQASLFNQRIKAKSVAMQAGQYTMLALQYYQKTKETLHGADEHGDVRALYAAMPQRDKMFFQEFLEAPPRDREKILRMVPRDQRRFYQAKWGLPTDPRPDLSTFFAGRNLPGPTWEGWQPYVDLEDVKVKFLENKGLELGEFGYYKDDLRNSKKAPPIEGGLFVNPFKALDIGRLQATLEGRGLRDIDIQIYTDVVNSPANLFNLNTNIQYNKQDEISAAMQDELKSSLY